MNEMKAIPAPFFTFLRLRLDKAGKSRSPLGLIIACRYLGLVAEHWMATSEEPEQTTPADRMRLFLARHGHHDAWSRVSAPCLVSRVGSARERMAREGRFPFERFQPDRISPVATWKNDPSFHELASSGAFDRGALVDCSYPGILYDDLISKCDSAADSHVFELPWHDELAEGAPRYKYESLTNTARLIFSASFLVDTALRAVKSFEAEARARDIVPFTNRA